jgi:hypothetical protein
MLVLWYARVRWKRGLGSRLKTEAGPGHGLRQNFDLSELPPITGCWSNPGFHRNKQPRSISMYGFRADGFALEVHRDERRKVMPHPCEPVLAREDMANPTRMRN